MKKLILILLLVIITSQMYSQNNHVYIKDKKYPSTKTWDLNVDNEDQFIKFNSINVTIAKKINNSGYLILSANTDGYECFVSGIITIFLENGSLIKCKYIFRNKLNGEISSYYDLTPQNIIKLKESTIESIRFTIFAIGIMGAEKEGGYQVYNKENAKNKYSAPTTYYKTKEEIEELFEN